MSRFKFSLHRDYETKSTVDLKRTGVHVYAAHESTDAWCCAYAVNDEPGRLWWPGDPVPPEFKEAAKNPEWEVAAFNDAFEAQIEAQTLKRRYDWPVVPLERHRCIMAQCLAMALPGSLENAAAALGIEQGKDLEGKGLMLRMAKPRRPRKGEPPDGLFWWDDIGRKERLGQYCLRDLDTEREVDRRSLPLRPQEQQLWVLDQRINGRGVFVDTALCNAATKIVDKAAAWLDEEMRQITKGYVSACSNRGQIVEWLHTYGGLPDIDSIAKGELDDLLLRRDISPSCRRVLELRREAAKASVAKIDALLEGKSADGRARGLLQYHSASTGRWAGRRFQPQNLPRGTHKDVDAAVAAVATGDAEYVQTLYGEPLGVVSGALRSLIRAAPGRRLLVADFSNIEGRVQAWFGDEQWKLDAFRAFDAGTGSDIYKLAYARAFGIRVEDVDDHMRQIGKVMELALGYAGGVGAFQKMAAAYRVEVSDARADELKLAWREAHPGIKNYWYELENAAIAAVRNPGKTCSAGRIVFRMAGSFCFMRLPSGRAITYPYPRIQNVRTPWGSEKPTFTYKGVDAYTRKWCDQYAHGGVLFNNVVQGTARDIEAEAMLRIEAAGYPNVLNVHDEVVAEPKEGVGSVAEFERLMTALPAWAEGLPVSAAAWEGERYKKG